MKEVEQPFTCNKCGEIVEVMWPMDQGWIVLQQ